MEDFFIDVSDALTATEQAILLERFQAAHPECRELPVPDVLEAGYRMRIHPGTVERMQASFEDTGVDSSLVAAATLAAIYLDGEATSPRVSELIARVLDS